MTYRELLKLYQDGTLDEEKRKKVEADIERQEAIGDYLYEKEEIPGLADIAAGEEGAAQSGKHDGEKAGKDSENGEKPDNGEALFVKNVQKMIRRAFVKMGVTVGAVLFVLVLGVIFVLPKAVDLFFYNPNEIVGKDEETGTITTNRMSLDISVYSELYWPASYRSQANAVSNGYGTYQISIPQGFYYTRNTTVNGVLKRGKLTLYNTDVLKSPSGNTFFVPEEVEQYATFHYYDQDTKKSWGINGTWENAYSAIEELSDTEKYRAYVSLKSLTDYADFLDWTKEQFGGADGFWCALYTSYENQYMCSGSVNTGILINPSGTCKDWDRATYPYLCQLDNSDSDSWDMSEDPEKMKTHFISLLSYMRDHPELADMLEYDRRADYDGMIESVERDGLRVYGFSFVCQKDTLMKLRDNPEVSYICTIFAE